MVVDIMGYLFADILGLDIMGLDIMVFGDGNLTWKSDMVAHVINFIDLKRVCQIAVKLDL